MRSTLVLTLALAVSLSVAADPNPQSPARALGSRNDGPAGAGHNSNIKRLGTNAERFRAGLPPLPPKPKAKKNHVVSLEWLIVFHRECVVDEVLKQAQQVKEAL